MASRGLKNLHVSEKLGVALYSTALDVICAGGETVNPQHCELMTGVYRLRVRFACYVSVTGVDRALDTLLQVLVDHLDKRWKDTSCLLLIHDCFSAGTFSPCMLGCLVISASDRQAVRVSF